MQATVDLVIRHGTANIAVSDIAEAAGMSRQLVYLHFGDRDTLLLEAALDLARRELMAGRIEGDAPVGRERALAAARHFAKYRVFYRALLNSASAFALNKALGGLLAPVNQRTVETHLNGVLDERRIEDLAMFLTGGGGAVINTWLTEAEDPLDPDDLADRLMALGTMILGALESVSNDRPSTSDSAVNSPKETDR